MSGGDGAIDGVTVVLGRRGFISSLLAAAVLDPERLLWVPGRKMISISKPRAVEVGDIVSFDGFQSKEVWIVTGIDGLNRWWMKPIKPKPETYTIGVVPPSPTRSHWKVLDA